MAITYLLGYDQIRVASHSGDLITSAFEDARQCFEGDGGVEQGHLPYITRRVQLQVVLKRCPQPDI